MYILFVAIISGLVLSVYFFVKDLRHNKKNVVQQIELRQHEVLIDYSIYKLSLKEFLFFFLIAAVVLYGIGYIFYQNHVISFVLSLFAWFYPNWKQKELVIRRKEDLALQFKHALYGLSSALIAGKSIDNAFIETIHDLKYLYPDPNTYIIKEFEIIKRRIENGDGVEQGIINLSNRSHIDDIKNFADVFVTGKRTGGDMVEIIRRTSDILNEKIEMKQEITVLIAQKKFEAKILVFAPFLMIGLISYSSPDYMEPLYQGITGQFIMTISLLLLLGAFWLTTWIMDIKV